VQKTQSIQAIISVLRLGWDENVMNENKLDCCSNIKLYCLGWDEDE